MTNVNVVNTIITLLLTKEVRDINISGSLYDHILIEFCTYGEISHTYKKTKKQIIITPDNILFHTSRYDINEPEVIWKNHIEAYVDDKLTPEA